MHLNLESLEESFVAGTMIEGAETAQVAAAA
jgi:hypothetical protein